MKTIFSKLGVLAVCLLRGCQECPAQPMFFGEDSNFSVIDGGTGNCSWNSHVILIDCTNYTTTVDWQIVRRNVAHPASALEFWQCYRSYSGENFLPFVTNEIRWEALSMQESGDDDNAVGPAGEVSRYQILPSVWRQYTELPLSEARNPLTARAVAEAVMRDRIRHCGNPDYQPDDFNWAILWKAPAFITDYKMFQTHPHLFEIKKEQSQCVVNLMHKFSTTKSANHAK